MTLSSELTAHITAGASEAEDRGLQHPDSCYTPSSPRLVKSLLGSAEVESLVSRGKGLPSANPGEIAADGGGELGDPRTNEIPGSCSPVGPGWFPLASRGRSPLHGSLRAESGLAKARSPLRPGRFPAVGAAGP